MSAAASAPLRTLAFGGPDSGSWGLVWSLGDDAVAACAGHAAAVAPAGLGPDRVEADGIALEVSSLHEITIAYEPGDDEATAPAPLSARICQVSGRLALPTGELAVDHLGIEVSHMLDEFGALDSFRQVLAWFAPDDALAVSSARPRKTAGHDRDQVLAAMFEPDGPLAIDETRLSTTYGSGGAAIRMGLELWTSDEEHGYPRRAAGEASEPPVAVQAATAELQVQPMRCHRAGRDGPGLYVLARPLGASR